MSTKNLYVMVQDGGDGSYSTGYTMDAAWIARREQRYANDEFEHGDLGCDGDGFHYDVIRVPADSTYESLGISNCADDEDEDELIHDEC